MGPIDLAVHLLNFAAPALALGVLLALCGRVLMGAEATVTAWWLQAAINTAAGVLALLAGLWFFGRDGKIASYTALVVAAALSEWLLVRGWKR